MLLSYIRLAWRNIVRTKWYSALNILGLAIGMAVALLIAMWVRYEYSYDRFLPGYGQLYQVARNFDNNGETLTFKTCSIKLADVLHASFPQLEVAETDYISLHGLKAGNNKFLLYGGQVNDNFLQLFGYPLMAGNPASVLKDPYSIVVTQSTAKSLFGDQDPIGQFVRFDNKDNLKVTGVLKDVPTNSSFRFDYLVPFSYYEHAQGITRGGNFSNNGYQIFVRLKPGVSEAQVRSELKDIEKTEKDNVNAMKSEVILQPMRQWHLWSDYQNGKPTGGMIDYVRMFSVIGLLILAIACINFVNLETARSEKRAREVGVRKAIGSGRRDLIAQFLTESFLLTFMALLCAVALAALALPLFNSLAETNMRLPFDNPLFWAALLACWTLTALLAGSRPALYLSSFNPVEVLKGSYQPGKSAGLPRKILIVVQFSCSIALIISTIIIYQQIRYTRTRPTGYDTNRLLATNINEDLFRNYTAIKQELLQAGVVDHVTTSSSPATNVWWRSDIQQWPGKMPGETVEMGIDQVSDDYFSTMGMSLERGRDFAGPIDSTCVIFNEAAIKRLRLKNPLNQVINFQGTRVRIIGIVKDALLGSPFTAVEPIMFGYVPANASFILYHLSPRVRTSDALAKLTEIFNRYEPSYPFDYHFVNEQYARKFDLEMLIGRLSGVLAALAIFISCLGLLGLAAYTAEQRTKEIGIRKVLGASVPQVWLLLSRDFILLVFISCLVASPLAFYFLHHWLLHYDYRITIQPLVFVVAGLAALGITLVTTSLQSIRAALANPVKSLKAE